MSLPESAIARIYDKDQKNIVGAGFIVQNCNKKYVITCAHVVNAALEKPLKRLDFPEGENIYLDFPFANQEEIITEQVIYWIPYKNDSCILRETGADMALLELKLSSPEDAQPIQLIEPNISVTDNNHEFKICGFPNGQKAGVWAYGNIKDSLSNGRIQIETYSSYNIERGYSGAPVLDQTLNQLVGMTVKIDPNKPTVAFMTPVNQINNFLNNYLTSKAKDQNGDDSQNNEKSETKELDNKKNSERPLRPTWCEKNEIKQVPWGKETIKQPPWTKEKPKQVPWLKKD